MTETGQQLARQIPSVAEFLGSEAGARLAAEFGVGLLKLELRAVFGEVRAAVLAGARGAVPGPDEMERSLRARMLRVASASGRAAINATGILLHTGLGRAPLCEEAVAALAVAGRYSLLQTDAQSGARSRRDEKVEHLLRELTGCEAATVVNNNAAATALALSALAEGREVIVSRGQLIEIGGSFRLPDVMARSGAIMREVGTTNRTHLRDYRDAICERTGAIIHVHTSNYRVRGFAGSPGIGELCDLGRERSVPVIDDLGSGALVPLSQFGLDDEPLVRDSVAAGSDAACFSGDKLICGPQSGIICGRREVIDRIRKDPFARMFRVCKLTLAALEATLVHFVNGTWRERLSFYRMLSMSGDDVRRAAESLAARLEGVPGLAVSTAEEPAYVGSGSLPDQGLPGRVVALSPSGISVDGLARRLRTGLPAVFGRISGERLLLDPRTVFPDEIEVLAARVREVMA